MTWQTGTSVDYLDLLDQVQQVATSNHIHTPVINAAGTGYSVDDILTVVGGTSTHVATIRVLTVGGSGEVLTMRMETGGAYTSNPSLTANAVTDTGAGSGATVDLSAASTGWTTLRATQEALSAVIAAGGTGYSVSDQLTVVGGLGVGTVAVFNVDSLSGSAVATVSLVTAGDYEEMPSNPAAVTGGTGTGCTLTVTSQDSTGAAERVLILEGNGGASETILIGMKSLQALDETGFDTVKNWSCHGFTGFNAGLEFHQQAGISPGVSGSTGDPNTLSGAFMPLLDSAVDGDVMDFWFNFTNRRLIIVVKVADVSVTHYVSAYMGFMNPFGTSTEFPYPIYVAASSARSNTYFSDTEPRITGLSEVVGLQSKTGPAWYRKVDNTWQEIKNSSAADGGSPSRTISQLYTVYPAGKPASFLATGDDIITSDGSGFLWEDVIPPTGLPGTATLKLADTEDSGGDVKELVPLTLVASNSAFLEIVGELDDCFWFSGVGGVTPEDTITDGAELYRVFPNGNRSGTALEFGMFAVKETF